MSTLSLVDLAGSESVRLANTHGQRQIEGGFINKSLLTLGKVVSMLTEDGETDMARAASCTARRVLGNGTRARCLDVLLFLCRAIVLVI